MWEYSWEYKPTWSGFKIWTFFLSVCVCFTTVQPKKDIFWHGLSKLLKTVDILCLYYLDWIYWSEMSRPPEVNLFPAVIYEGLFILGCRMCLQLINYQFTAQFNQFTSNQLIICVQQLYTSWRSLDVLKMLWQRILFKHSALSGLKM